MRRQFGLIIVSATLFAGMSAASADVVNGGPCSPEHQTMVSNGQVFICAPSASGALTWQHFDRNAPGGIASNGNTSQVNPPTSTATPIPQASGNNSSAVKGPGSKAPKVGERCLKVGKLLYLPTETLLCKGKGKLLFWTLVATNPKIPTNGVVTVTPTPSATPAIPTPSASPSVNNSTNNNNSSIDPAQLAPPIFENLGVSFGVWDKNTNRSGDFLFTQTQGPARGPISLFADPISTGSGTKLTSEIGWDYLAAGTPVQAVASGIVTGVKFQADTNDYELWEQTTAGSQWTIIYDHVQGLKITEGARVSAGSPLGSAVGTGLPFFELQVVQRIDGVNHQWCPTKFLDPAHSEAILSAIRQLESDWQVFKSDSKIYSSAHEVIAGCLQESYIGG